MRLFFFFTCIVLCGGCTKKEFCIQPATSSTMTMVFKTYDDNQKLVDSPLIGATVTTTDTAHLFANNVPKLTAIGVFLNRNHTQQTFEIFHSGEQDTIVVFYNAEAAFISNGCGYRTNFNLIDVSFSKKNIQTINIKNASVNETPANHLEVIYK